MGHFVFTGEPGRPFPGTFLTRTQEELNEQSPVGMLVMAT